MSKATDESKKRVEESMVIAREIFKLLGEMNSGLLLGDFNKDEGFDFYRKFVEDKIMPVLHEKNVRTADVPFIMSIVMQPYDFIKGVLDESVTVAEDNAVAAKFGLENIREMRFSDIVKAQLEAAELKNNSVDKSNVVNKKDLE